MRGGHGERWGGGRWGGVGGALGGRGFLFERLGGRLGRAESGSWGFVLCFFCLERIGKTRWIEPKTMDTVDVFSSKC